MRKSKMKDKGKTDFWKVGDMLVVERVRWGNRCVGDIVVVVDVKSRFGDPRLADYQILFSDGELIWLYHGFTRFCCFTRISGIDKCLG